MKKLIAITLTLSFILALVPFAFSVSAAETLLNSAGKGWTVCRSDPSFVVDSTDDYDFHIKGDAEGKTWSWPVYREESLSAGTIEATFKASACIGIFFGATGIKEYVGDSHEKIAGTNEAKVSMGDTAHDIRYYSASVVWEKHDSGNYKFRLHRDGDAEGTEAAFGNSVALGEAAHGINGTDDFTLKVTFDGKGNLKCYVNDVLVVTRTDVVPYGDQFGVLVRNSNYGTANANQRVGYVKDFAFSTPDFLDWTPRRGAAAVTPKAGIEYQWRYQGTAVYNNPVRYNTDLSEGVVRATLSKGAKAGIIFGATGLDNVKDGSEANISAGNAPNLRYYWAYVDGAKVVLEVDNTAAEGSQSRVKLAEADLPASVANSSYTIKVNFTSDGDATVFVNNVEYITKTDLEIYGSELGMMAVAQQNAGTNLELAGEVIDFVFGEDAAPSTGDAYTVYITVGCLTLLSLAALAFIFRKRKTVCE